jgi:hypothetical protein
LTGKSTRVELVYPLSIAKHFCGLYLTGRGIIPGNT